MEIIQEKEKSEICSHIREYDSSASAFHWHNRFEICMPLNKSCRFLVDGVLIEGEKGDIITIDEQIVHRFLIDNDNTHIRIIQFPLKILLNSNVSVKPLKTHITKKETDAIPNLRETLNSILDITDKEGFATYAEDNPFLQSLCISLYFLLMRHFQPEGILNSSQKDRIQFFAIADFVNQHFNEDIDVNNIASELYISRGRMTSLFLKYSGVRLNEYINALRIKNANRLIMSGSTMTEAAFESGFQSIRTFNNAYKSLMGITPSEFIKKTQQNNEQEI